MGVDVGLVVFALGVGAATFFSPCAVALLPAYAAFFAGTGGDDPAPSLRASAWGGLRFGTAAAVGAALVFAVGAALVYLLRTRLGLLGSRDLLAAGTGVGIVVGLALVALGLLMLADRGPSLSLPVQAPRSRTVPAMVAFGGLFALGSIGCTLPVFLGVVGAALSQDSLGGTATLAAYGLGLSGLLLVGSLGLAVAEERVSRLLREARRHTRVVSGVLLVAAGVYIIVYYGTRLPA